MVCVFVCVVVVVVVAVVVEAKWADASSRRVRVGVGRSGVGGHGVAAATPPSLLAPGA